MKKYSKEELRKIDRFDLFDIQYTISDKIKIAAIINIALCVFCFLVKDTWFEWIIRFFTIGITVYMVILLIRFLRIEKILEEDDENSMPKEDDHEQQ